MPDVVTIGETMVAMLPSKYGALRYVTDFHMTAAGAESNLAIGLSKLGHDVGWVSRLGNDEMGLYIRNFLRAEGVDTSQVVFDDKHRTGLLVKETNYSKETKVYYYRDNSAASWMTEDDIKPDYWKNTKILHLTGITPILSDSCRQLTDMLVKQAKEYGVMLSFDPNIRKKLWNGRDYSSYIRSIVLQSDIILMGIEEANILLQTKDVQEIIQILYKEGKPQYVALKDGGNGAWVSNGKETIHIPPYPVNVIETVGAGDGFNAGFLAGILQGETLDICGRMGGIAGALATETIGDTEGYPTKEQMSAILTHKEELFR